MVVSAYHGVVDEASVMCSDAMRHKLMMKRRTVVPCVRAIISEGSTHQQNAR